MKEKVLRILNTKTVQHSVVTLGATLINGVLGALFFLIVARNLGPEDFGIVSFSIIVVTLIADIADFGINTGIINFVSKHIRTDETKVKQILKLSLESKILIWIVLFLAGWILMPYIATNLLQKPQLEFYLRFSLLGVGGAMLYSFVTNSLQAMQRYRNWSYLNIAMNTIRLLLIIFLVFFLVLNTLNTLLIYIAITFLGFFIGITLLPKKFLFVKDETAHFQELFHFNKWIALTIFLSAISSRFDSILITKFSNLSDLGLYSVANQLTSYLPQLSSAIAVVVAPKFGSLTNNKDASKYFWKLQFLCLGLGLLALIIIPIIWVLIPVFYGVSYSQSSLIFAILFIGNLIFFVSIPAHQAIYYYFSKSNIAFFITMFTFIVSLISISYLVINYGSIGAAIGVCLASLFNLVISTIWVLNKFKNE